MLTQTPLLMNKGHIALIELNSYSLFIYSVIYFFLVLQCILATIVFLSSLHVCKISYVSA